MAESSRPFAKSWVLETGL